MSDKYSLLKNNIFYLVIGNLFPKIFSFLLVPLYTGVLTTQEYGTFDFINSTVSLITPVLTAQIMSAVFIYAIDEKYNKEDVLCVGLRILGISSVALMLVVHLNYIWGWIAIIKQYSAFFLLMYIFNALSGVLSEFVRASGNLKNYTIGGALNSLIIVIGNVLLLLVFPLGINGYFIANICAPLGQSLFLFIKEKLWKYIAIKIKDSEITKRMLDFSTPLVLNSVSWWINSTSDRYIVTAFCGLAENGVYSIAGKIPAMLNIVQSIFSQAWVVSAIKEFDPEDNSGFFANMYGLYSLVMLGGCSLLIALNRTISRFLYAQEFYAAWKYVPFLLIAGVFGALSGFTGSIFSAVKNSRIQARSTVVGSVINFVVNLLLVPGYGAMAAAFSTCLAYFIIWLIRIRQVRKMMVFRFRISKNIAGFALVISQMLAIFLIPNDTMSLWLFHMGSIAMLLLLHKRELRFFFQNFCKR